MYYDILCLQCCSDVEYVGIGIGTIYMICSRLLGTGTGHYCIYYTHVEYNIAYIIGRSLRG